MLANEPTVTVHLRDCADVNNYVESNSFVILHRKTPGTTVIFLGLNTLIDGEPMIVWGMLNLNLTISLTFYDNQWHIIS